jgi:hypothetical protein
MPSQFQAVPSPHPTPNVRLRTLRWYELQAAEGKHPRRSAMRVGWITREPEQRGGVVAIRRYGYQHVS